MQICCRRKKNSETLEQMNDVNGNSSESETEMHNNGGNGGFYDSAPLAQFDFQREAEEIRRTGTLYLLKMKHRDRASQTAMDSFVENTTCIVRTKVILQQ